MRPNKTIKAAFALLVLRSPPTLRMLGCRGSRCGLLAQVRARDYKQLGPYTGLWGPVSMHFSGRKIAFGVAYVLGLLILCVVSAEVFLRFMLPDPQRYYVWPPHMHVVFQPSDEATPGISGPGHFITNSLGLRSDEPPPDRKRTIYVFGGSTGADVYLDQREAWVTQTQDLINAMPGQPRTWIGNLSRSSLASLHALLQFEYLVPTLPKADLFLVYAGANDLQLALKSSYLPNMTRDMHMDWTFSLRPGSGGVIGDLALARFWRRLKDWWIRSTIGVTQTYEAGGYIAWRRCRQTAPQSNLVHELPDLTAALSNYRQNLNELMDRAVAYGAPIVFLTQAAIWSEHMSPEDSAILLAAGVGPNNIWCDEQKYFASDAMAKGLAQFNAVMLDVCRDRKTDCIDLGREITKSRANFYDDMHFNEEGASKAAHIVAEKIANMSRLDVSGKGRALR